MRAPVNARRKSLLRAVLVLVLAACASPAAPRVIVQQDALAKSDFEGVWYFRQTVVGVPFTTGFTFIGEQGENELEKIRWDIQEELLVARRAFEFVKGSEIGEPSHGDKDSFLGAPVAAFKISSQFDIVREYNPSTGEEYDRVVENTERKWFDRQFIRVDWSQNLVTNFQFLADWNHGGISAIRQDPAPYYVSDPKDPDALRLERPSATEQATYLEVTQKLMASPETVDFEGFLNVPLCYLEYATQDCASQEIKLRNSFLRAGTRDYEPLVYSDNMMDRFGYFTTNRASYNRQYGQTESGRVRLINRFDLWRRSLTPTSCTKDAECGAAEPGVRCALELADALVDPIDGHLTGRCTLPYARRNLTNPADPASADLGPRPIVYHVDDHFPRDLVDSTRLIEKEYDDTWRGIYKSILGKDSPHAIYVLCTNNPVLAGDPAACGPAGTHARIGDLRFNMLVWVDEPTSAQLLGYGPSSHDPETGETIEATAFVYGAEVDAYAAQARDIVRLVNGDLASDKFIDGIDVRAWVQANQAGSRHKATDQAEVDKAGRDMNTEWTRGFSRAPKVRKGSQKRMADERRARNEYLARSQALGADAGLASRRLALANDTDLERALSTGEMLLARGLDPRMTAATLDTSKVRPLSLANPEVAKAIRRERRRLGAKAVDVGGTFDDAVIGFALAQKGKDPTEVWRKVRQAVFRSTAAHELGHTFGLRHNFAGSYDAMNYPKQYWDLRNKDGKPKPRYLDPETDAELAGVETEYGFKAGISEFQTSSIMDYGAKFNSDINGIGRYDRAALKFGYGQLVEVFDDIHDHYRLGALQSTVTFGLPQPILGDCSADNWISIHYTQLPEITDLDDRVDVPWSAITNSVPPSDCVYPDAVDHDAHGRLVVPFRFCSDEFEGASPDCRAFDRGADVYETAQNAIDAYRNYYFFNNFKRDRMGFGPDAYFDRIYERYLDPLRSQMQFYSLFRADYADSIDAADPFWTAPGGYGPFTFAVKKGFDLLGEILVTPEPGGYARATLEDGREAWMLASYDEPSFTLDVPFARFQQTSWEYDSGYFWYERISHIGGFLDKVAALSIITDPETSFLGQDEASDLRQYAINYYRLYPEQITESFTAMLTDRWDRYAPLWDGTRMTMRPISEPLTDAPAGQLPIDPQFGFSAKLWAGTLGMALIPATFDTTWTDSSRIFLRGGDALDPNRPLVHFDDPFGGKRYLAVSFLKNGVETGIGARMLARADELAGLVDDEDPATTAALRGYIEVLEALRTVSVTFSNEIR